MTTELDGGQVAWLVAMVLAAGYLALTAHGRQTSRKLAASWASRADRKSKDKRERDRLARTPISEVGVKGEGGLACPKCGGTQFQARRTKAARTGVVMGGLAGAAMTKQKQVTCVTCGTIYKRG